MDFKDLKTAVKEISEIAASVPEQFRDKCFELLLSSLLSETRPAEPADEKQSKRTEDEANTSQQVLDVAKSTTIPLTTQLRLLMKKTGVTTQELDNILMYDNQEVHFIKEPHDIAISAGQMEWSLLLALKNAILKDSLSTDPEDVRSICQEKGFYDKANFATNFKSAKSARLFKSALVPQGEAQSLSSDGQDALGRLIKRLASEASQ